MSKNKEGLGLYYGSAPAGGTGPVPSYVCLLWPLGGEPTAVFHEVLYMVCHIWDWTYPYPKI